MNILWLSWKDEHHPLAGGAEVISTELRRRLVKDGHSVILLTAFYLSAKKSEKIEGVQIYRNGGKYSVYHKSRKFFKNNLKNWPDLIIDEMNTVPFFAYTYKVSTPTILLTYQLARTVWFFQMVHPFSLFGYIFESMYLRFISSKYKHVVTESKSTKIDLQRFGFESNNISVFRVGMKNSSALNSKRKYSNRIMFLGSVRPMKRTFHAVKAFEKAKDRIPELELGIVGDYSGKYGQKLFRYVSNSPFANSIRFYGKVSQATKEKLLSETSLIVITSIKEGWGLIATEAAAYRVPAVAYDVDGLRDSVLDGKTGLLAKSGDYVDLGEKIYKALNDKDGLEIMGLEAVNNSKQYTFENCYADFIDILKRQKLFK